MSRSPISVVGAVIEINGNILCARRAQRSQLGGLWEFPGGKVEMDEDPRAALCREVSEELGCVISVGKKLIESRYAYSFAIIQLTTYSCELRSGSPRAIEHADLRWLKPDLLHSLDWTPSDLPTVEYLQKRGDGATT